MTTALYRRYRPETFDDVIGQEHVTEPLMAAIAGGRVSHAYLFSGPRGCGKTTSARILARCLNCANGPAPSPCGECDSCRELARGGSGSLDVVEIDAASHNGVDDARELRERAAFAPARDRFKIFILDEAHMVTPQGFNALLKLVEEPPEHVKFIFATTEPEKVISTIRSRTHHYPFRLVPPETLQAYLEQIASAEGVQVGAGVLPLVVRAGGGSVRDSLSVLDQLLAGAEGVLDYVQTVALLGYTPAALLDDAVDALAAGDGASVFRVVDRVMESGHEPRRFVEDLLQRLRDLIVIVAAGERAADALKAVPADQFQRMQTQAGHLGLAQLSRAADLTSEALTEMTGATSPRLQLELLCARLLLPAADEPVRGYGARLERLEQRFAEGAMPVSSPIVDPGHGPDRKPPPATPTAPEPRGAGSPDAGTSGPALALVPEREPSAPRPGRAPESAPGAERPGATPAASPPVAAEQAEPRLKPNPAVAAGPSPASPSAPPSSGGLDTETLRRRWPEVLETLSRARRSTWILVSQNAQVQSLGETSLRLRFDTSGIASTFRSGSHAEAVQQALHQTLGLRVRVDAAAGEDEAPAAGRPGGPPRGGRWSGEPRRVRDGSTSGRSDSPPARSDEPQDAVARAAADWATPADRADQPGGAAPVGDRSAGEAATRPKGRPPRGRSPEDPSQGRGAPAGHARAPDIDPPPEPPVEDEPDPFDADLDGDALLGASLVEQILGATVIDEISLGPDGAPRVDEP